MIGITDHRNRRRYPRAQLNRPVKLQCTRTGRYLSGQTCDVSAGGALIEVAQPSLLVSGQELAVGIAWTNRNMLLGESDMVPAIVTRSLGLGGKQQVAVQFSHYQQLQLAISA